MIKEKRVNYCLIAICALCLCLWGGIYDFTIAIYGCIFCIGIITVVRKKDRLSIPVNITSAGLIIILICSIISSVAARDHGIAVIGILRIVVFIVFWILWCRWRMLRARLNNSHSAATFILPRSRKRLKSRSCFTYAKLPSA